MEDIVKHFAEWGVSGILAGALLWFLWYRETVAIPKQFERFAEELKNERESCERRHELLMVSIKETRHAVKDLGQSLKVNNAMTRALLRHAFGKAVVDGKETENKDDDNPKGV